MEPTDGTRWNQLGDRAAAVNHSGSQPARRDLVARLRAVALDTCEARTWTPVGTGPWMATSCGPLPTRSRPTSRGCPASSPARCQ
ncbi:hypothetical protein KCV87_35520 [Actinosynnema pretiosum subsp. pretiosum]|uniref:Uncharacterized protein n=1 Tax=Actinosynnema pretiosum subsp. pretiosum TaxID=103721 RepID=A0AA45L843_9PSEU|nr:hypothetical protein KCV87_35520 [Actinosynnema pretiosum subsp. pretiosum]